MLRLGTIRRIVSRVFTPVLAKHVRPILMERFAAYQAVHLSHRVRFEIGFIRPLLNNASENHNGVRQSHRTEPSARSILRTDRTAVRLAILDFRGDRDGIDGRQNGAHPRAPA
jgi:hypothetical protein